MKPRLTGIRVRSLGDSLLRRLPTPLYFHRRVGRIYAVAPSVSFRLVSSIPPAKCRLSCFCPLFLRASPREVFKDETAALLENRLRTFYDGSIHN